MSRAVALLLALCALVLPSIARAHGRGDVRVPGWADVRVPGRVDVRVPGRVDVRVPGRVDVRMPGRVDVRVPGRASGAVVAGAESRVGSPEFLQRDPEGYVDSVNVYAAMANDPVNNRDPTGRDAENDREVAACLAAHETREYCQSVYGDHLAGLPTRWDAFKSRIGKAWSAFELPFNKARSVVDPVATEIVENMALEVVEPIRVANAPRQDRGAQANISLQPLMSTNELQARAREGAATLYRDGANVVQANAEGVVIGAALARALAKAAELRRAARMNRLPVWTQGTPARGILDTGRAEFELASGSGGGPPALPFPGRNNTNFFHVEAHAAQIMRVENLTEATLQINKVPCPVGPGCANNLPNMLPQGARLRVIGPDGYDHTFVGRPDPPGYPR